MPGCATCWSACPWPRPQLTTNPCCRGTADRSIATDQQPCWEVGFMERIRMTLVFLVLTACGGSKPSETEIHTALAEKIGQKKGCATSVLFDTLPIKQDRVASNQS